MQRLNVMVFWLAVQLLCLKLAIRTSNVPKRRSFHGEFLLVACALIALAIRPQNIHPLYFFSTLPIWLALIIVSSLKRFRSVKTLGAQNRLVMGVGFTVFGLALLAKIMLHARIYHYGFVLAMPAVMACIGACWWVAEDIRRRGGSPRRFTLTLFFAFSPIAGLHFALMQKALDRKQVGVTVGDVTVRCTSPEANFLNAVLEDIPREIGADETLAVWPQGGLINFAVGRINPTPYAVLMPPEIMMFGEEQILRSYQAKPPDYILLVHCDTPEYGTGNFGQGYGILLWNWMWENYTRVREYGEPPFVSEKFGLVLLKLNLGAEPLTP